METAQPKKKSKNVLLAVFIIGLMGMGILGYNLDVNGGRTTNTQATLTCAGTDCNLNVPISINLALQINVTDHGKLLSSHTFPHDLILNNFYNWLIQFLNNAQSNSATVTSNVVNTAGTTKNLDTWGTFGSTVCTTVLMINCPSPGQGGLIEVGTLSTPATRTDTNIGNAFQSYFDTSSVCSTGSTDSIVISGSQNANSGTTITESGLFIQSDLAGVANTFMIAHDVFSGIVVSAGNTITIQYTWSLNNSGFNYNLCEYFAGLLTQPNGSGNQAKTPAALAVFFDTSNRNVTWYQSCQSGASSTAQGSLWPTNSGTPTSSNCAAWGAGDTNNAMQIAIGTGSSSFTPATRALTSFYAQNYITSTTYDSAGNAYETANIVLATGATISEAAIYLTLPKGCIGYSPLKNTCVTSYGSDTIMLLAATFTGQVVPNGQSIGITFQESG